jgi:hypothetical protein
MNTAVVRTLPDVEQLGLHHLPGLGVERGERFVEQQQLRVGRQCAGQRPLLHATGQLARVRVLETLETGEASIVVC